MQVFFFDIDDTLYKQADVFAAAYTAVFGDRFSVDLTELFVRSRHHSDVVFKQAQSGQISMTEMYIYRLKNAFADFSLRISDKEALEFQQLYAYQQKQLSLDSTTAALLSYITTWTVAGVITNGPAEHQWKKVWALGLEKWISDEHIIVSGDVGIHKPSAEIFELARTKMQAEAAECWYIGDSWENDICGAAGAGWNTIWLNRYNRQVGNECSQADYTVSDNAALAALIARLLPQRS